MLQTMRMLQQALIEQPSGTSVTIPSTDDMDVSDIELDTVLECATGSLTNEATLSSADILGPRGSASLNYLEGENDSVADLGLAGATNQSDQKRHRSASITTDTMSTDATSEPLDLALTRRTTRSIKQAKESRKSFANEYGRKRKRSLSNEVWDIVCKNLKESTLQKTALTRDKKASSHRINQFPSAPKDLVSSSHQSNKRRAVIQFKDTVEEPSIPEVQETAAHTIKNEQILDFQLRIPKDTGDEREVLSLLRQILQEVRILNRKLNETQEAKEATEVIPEDAISTKEGDKRGRGQRSPSTIVRDERRRLTAREERHRGANHVRKYVPSRFNDIRTIVEEVADELLSKNQRNCRECHLPYVVQRNKDVLEFRCFNLQGHNSRVYGGRVPDHVLDKVWETVQERGVENVFCSPRVTLPRRREVKEVKETGLSASESPKIKQSPTQSAVLPSYEVAEEPSRVRFGYDSKKLITSESWFYTTKYGSSNLLLLQRSSVEGTDTSNNLNIKAVGLEVINQILPKEQLICKICREPYSLNRNKDALELRCRNTKKHTSSSYGGRLPRNIMDLINETLQERRNQVQKMETSSSIPVTPKAKSTVEDDAYLETTRDTEGSFGDESIEP